MKRRRLRALPRCDRGNTVVQFALLCMPVLLFLFGAFEFAIAFWTEEALQRTVVAGARCAGIVEPTCGTAGVYSQSMTITYIQSVAASWLLTLPTANITINTAANCGGISGFTSVTITYTYTYLTFLPKIATSMGATTLMTASACYPNAAS